MIKLKLKNALSYSGVVSANERKPFVIVESQKVADQAMKTGYFEIAEAEVQTNETLQEPSNSDSEKYTNASLKKLNKEQQEEIITELGGNPEETKNEEERIALILELQEEGE